jgi:hypothetical protein
MHLGVVSSDMGTGADYDVSSCDATGDGGRLQDDPRASGCQPPSDPYLSNDPANFPLAELQDTFECVALLGNGGCAFEQPLEAMKVALDGSLVDNQGFLRPGSDLLIIIVTDEDDCSASDSTLYDPDATARWGSPTSHRCFEHGIVCDQPLDSPGTKTGCRPRDDGPLYPISRYVDFLNGLENAGHRLFVTAIAGTTGEVTVESSGEELELGPSCVSTIGEAFPALRIEALTDAFGERGLFTSVCAEDWSTAALANVTDWMAGQLGDPCVSDARFGDGSSCVMRRLTDQGAIDIERCPDPEELPDGGVVYPDAPDPCWTARATSFYCDTVRGLDAVEIQYRTQQPATGDPIELDCR